MKLKYSKQYSDTDAQALNSLNNSVNKRSFSCRRPILSRVGYAIGTALFVGGIMVFGPGGVLAKKKGAEPKVMISNQIEAVHKDLSVINELLEIQKKEFGDLPDVTLGVSSDQDEVIQLKKDLKPLKINLDDYLEGGRVTLAGIDKINAKLDELSAKTSSEEAAGSLKGLEAPAKEEVKPEVKEEVKPPVTEAVPKKEAEVKEEAAPEVKEEAVEEPVAAEAVVAFTPDMAMNVYDMTDGILKNYNYILGKGYMKGLQGVPGLLKKYEKSKNKTKPLNQLRAAMPWTQGMSEEEIVEQAGYVNTYLNLGKLSRIYDLASKGSLKGKEAKEFKTLCKSFGLKIGKKITDENYEAALQLAQTEMQSSITAFAGVVLGGTLVQSQFDGYMDAGEYNKAAELLAKELELSLHIVSMGVANYARDVNVPTPIIADFLTTFKQTNPFSVKENLLIGLETLNIASRHLVQEALDYSGTVTTDAEIIGNIEYLRFQISLGNVPAKEAIDQASELVKDVPGMDEYITVAKEMERAVGMPAFAPKAKEISIKEKTEENNKNVAFALLSLAEVAAAAAVHETPEAQTPTYWAGELFKAKDPVGALFFANLALNKILPYHGEIFQKYVYSHPEIVDSAEDWQHIMASELESPGLPFVPLHKMDGTVFAYPGELGTEGGISVYTGRLDMSDPEIAALVNMPQAIWTTLIPAGHNPFLEGEYPSEIAISGLKPLPEDALRYHTNPDIYKIGVAPASELLELKADALKKKKPNSKLLDAYRSLDLPLHHKLYLFDHVAALEGVTIEEPTKKPKKEKEGVVVEALPIVDLLDPELLSKGPDLKYLQVSDSVVTQHPDIADLGYEALSKLGIPDEAGNDLLDALGMAVGVQNNEDAAAAADALLDVLPDSSTETGLTGEDATKYDRLIQLLNQAKTGNKDALDEALTLYEELSGGRIAASTLYQIRAYAFDADAGVINAVEFGGGLRTEFILKQKEKEFLMLYLQAAYAQSSLFGTVKEVSVTELRSTGEIEYLEAGEEYDAKVVEQAGQFGFGVFSKKPIGKEGKVIWNFSSALSMSGGKDALIADIEGKKEVSSSDFFKIDNIGFETTWESGLLKTTPIGGVGAGVLNLVELRAGEWDVKAAPYIVGVIGVGNEIFDLKLRGGSILYPRAIPFVGASAAVLINGWTPFFGVNYTFNVSEEEGKKDVGALSVNAGVKTPTWHVGKMPMALELTVTGAALINKSNEAVKAFGGNVGVKGMIVIPIDVRKEKPTKEEFDSENTKLLIDNAEKVIADAEAKKAEITDTKKYENNMEKAYKYFERAKIHYNEGNYLDAALEAQTATDYAKAAITVKK